MTSTTPASQEPTLAQKQAQLAENLAKADRALARRFAKTAPLPPSKAVTLEDHILEATDDILRVSAGLQSVLTLLDLQAGDIPESIGLHALLLPLKQQLDQSANRLQSLV
ncbi:DUF1484 family protein [Cupriavidus taiwanensis]|uniref:DUF1484 domain-containing protein n=1 Tax=Cupriavidus taiwanensis TaxID=164546 RepID=A0A7Z7J428_9BURK|nr:DUF1484 family protein [Cupriavidus taiwanensis]SOY85130.1 conserved protein of unknown function [Cupriavidus taiwanensis]SOY99740.1 conserved hypothetical protein [Cupriavidus taiwanensis]SOZ02783.1 conserved hypothetical protein [Cupriavidus taiwanensis]SPC06150.1 conserved hypothetical protein [Cupriavidus taiwanensis]SPD38181.1 conserved protein of unknown function [Cupriavidus taiwanensis]